MLAFRVSKNLPILILHVSEYRAGGFSHCLTLNVRMNSFGSALRDS